MQLKSKTAQFTILRRCTTAARRANRLWSFRLARATASGVILLVAGELSARFILGLGTPPLSMADPTMEYRLHPEQDLFRFGNRIQINAYSMRSADFPSEKSNPNELRVMVFGDSVINGGSLTDQADLATERIKTALEDDTSRPVIVGNISAVSWGPANQLAYSKAFGFFDADVVAIVVSSHDADDVPVFAPLTQPQSTPWSALGEGVHQYLWPRLRGLVTAAEHTSSAPQERREPTYTGEALNDLSRLVKAALPRPVVVFHFPTRRETLQKDYHPIAKNIRSAVESAGGRFSPLCGSDRSQDWLSASHYRDNFHPNTNGQRWIADRMLPVIHETLGLPVR